MNEGGYQDQALNFDQIEFREEMPKLYYRKIVECDIRDTEGAMEGLPKDFIAGTETMTKAEKSLEAAKKRDMI